MKEIKSSIVYFKQNGRENSRRFMELVQRAKELGISTILAASSTGCSGSLAVKELAGLKVIFVSHVAG